MTTDLPALVNPVQQAVSMVQDALRDPERRIPSRSVAGAGWTKPVRAFEGKVAIAATAVTYLHQEGHLELHSYTDAKYPYSLAVAFVAADSGESRIHVAGGGDRRVRAGSAAGPGCLTGP